MQQSKFPVVQPVQKQDRVLVVICIGALPGMTWWKDKVPATPLISVSGLSVVKSVFKNSTKVL